MTLQYLHELPVADTLTGIELVEVSQPSSTVTITATTLSAAASDNSYNDSGNGFLTAGFAVGDRVRVSGFTGNVVNNITSGAITAITAAKMAIGGTDGDMIVDDAAGESVTISKWVTRRAALDEIGIGGGGGAYDVRIGFSATPTSDEIIDSILIVRDISFAADFAGSLGRVGTNPTATFDLDVLLDGVSVGTISVSTGGVFTFTSASNQVVNAAAGQLLNIEAPNVVDATIADLSVTLMGEY